MVPLLAALLLAQAAPAPVSPAAPKTAEQVEEAVKASEEELRRLGDKATSVLDELGKVEDEVHELQQKADAAEKDVRVALAKLALAQKAEEAAAAALVKRLDELSPRLKARYRMSKSGRMGFLLNAHSVGELLRRKRSLDRVLDSDLALLKDARALFDQRTARRAELQAARDEHAAASKTAQDRRARALRRKDELIALSDAVVEEKTLRQKTLSELYARQADLSKFVAELKPEPQPEPDTREREREKEKAAAASLAKRRGHCPFPTAGFIEVGFGKVLNARFNTVTFQNGIDVRAPEGTEVVSIGQGKVVHAGPFRGYGNLVIVDHGDGLHSLYAHLAAITRNVDEAVLEGDIVGLVGETGSIKGSYLYFEIREKGKAVNPKGWFGK